MAFPWVRRVHAARRPAVIVTFGVVTLVGLGHALGLRNLFQPDPNSGGTHVLTLLAVALLAAALALHRPLAPPLAIKRLLCVLALGIVALRYMHPMMAYAASVGLPGQAPVVMGHATSVTILLLALAILLRRSNGQIGLFVGSAASILPLATVVGHSFGINKYHGAMSLTTVLALVPLSVGVLTTYAHHRSVRLLFSNSIGARLARIQICAGVAFAWSFGLLTLGYRVIGAPDYEAFYVTVLIWFFALMMVLSALAHERTDRDRRSVERRLARFAATDPLTGLSNRRAAGLEGRAIFARAQREAVPLAVLLVDLDHFKQLNDRFGHGVGDEILKAVARVFDRRLRWGDLAARWGGEEFLILLPGAEADDALGVAERLRCHIQENVLPPDADHGGRVTVSMGLAALDAGDETLDQVIDRADRALYAAKARGRNQVVEVVGAARALGETPRRPGKDAISRESASPASVPVPGNST